MVKFSSKNWKLSLQYYDIFKKICQFKKKNLTVFIGKSKSLNVPVKIVKFSCKNR